MPCVPHGREVRGGAISIAVLPYVASPKNHRNCETLTESHSRFVNNSSRSEHFPMNVTGCSKTVTGDGFNGARSERM